MRFLTDDECQAWLSGRQLPTSKSHKFCERFPTNLQTSRLFGWSRQVANALLPTGKECLLWMTEWGIWTENLHLYHRVKSSYGDVRLLHEAPGHVFLDFEAADLATYLQVAVSNGWGGYLLTRTDYLSAFFSHDEFIDFFFDNESSFEELRSQITK